MPHSDEPYGRVPAPHDPELSRLANTLAVLQPRVRPLDRDALMFRAGQASVPRPGWKWPLAASLSSFLAVVLGATLVLRAAQGPSVVSATRPTAPVRAWQDQPPPVQFPALPEAPTTPSPYSPAEEPPLPRHLQIQEQILRWGLDGLPTAPAPSQPRPESIDMFLRSF